jgi:hypothetical protein
MCLFGMGLLLAACEHTPPTLIQPPSYQGKQVASADGAATGSGVECSREIPTGMRMPVTRCRDLTEVDRRRKEDRETIEKIPVAPHDVLLGR